MSFFALHRVGTFHSSKVRFRSFFTNTTRLPERVTVSGWGEHVLLPGRERVTRTIPTRVGRTRPDRRLITRLDFELLPHVWRDPDAVRPGNYPGDLIFEVVLLGRTVFTTWQTPGRAVDLKTLYVKR